MDVQYCDPWDSIGSPLNPGLLDDLGRFAGWTDSRRTRWSIWITMGQKNKHHIEGRLALSETPGALVVDQVLLGMADGARRLTGRPETAQGPWRLQATQQLGDKSIGDLRSWQATSDVWDDTGRYVAAGSATESGERLAESLHRRVHDVDMSWPLQGALTSDFALFARVPQLTREVGAQWSFTMLESGAVRRENQCLRYAGVQTHMIARESRNLHVFHQLGDGILPIEYYVDESDRLVLVIASNRFYIHDALCDPDWFSVVEDRLSAAPAVPPPAAAGAVRSTTSTRPNVVMICTDQQALDTIAAAGNAHIRTPNMDRLAARGMSFSQSYCTNPICSPSRSSMYTGRMPCETGVTRNDRKMRAGVPTIGEWLGRDGQYDCVWSGKWHVPICHDYHVPGFDTLAVGMDHFSETSDMITAAAAEAWLHRRETTGNPYLLVVNLLQPHDMCPWARLNVRNKPLAYAGIEDRLPPLPANFVIGSHEPACIADLRRRVIEGVLGEWSDEHWRFYLWSYYRMVEMVDGQIGRILDAIDARPDGDNTLIMFFADHGEGTAQHHLMRKGYPYESGLRVPTIIVPPGSRDDGRRDRDHLVSGLDFVPTICDYAGIEAPPGCSGRSLRPLLDGRDGPWRDHLISESGDPGPARILRTADYLYVRHQASGDEQLYHLASDPGELQNLAADPRCHTVLTAHRQQLDASFSALDPDPSTPEYALWPEHQPR